MHLTEEEHERLKEFHEKVKLLKGTLYYNRLRFVTYKILFHTGYLVETSKKIPNLVSQLPDSNSAYELEEIVYKMENFFRFVPLKDYLAILEEAKENTDLKEECNWLATELVSIDKDTRDIIAAIRGNLYK